MPQANTKVGNLSRREDSYNIPNAPENLVLENFSGDPWGYILINGHPWRVQLNHYSLQIKTKGVTDLKTLPHVQGPEPALNNI